MIADIHVFDKPQDMARMAEVLCHRANAMVVQPAFDHQVDLDRMQTAATAASFPSSTRAAGMLTSLITRKTASSMASRLTVNRCNLACFKSSAMRANTQIRP